MQGGSGCCSNAGRAAYLLEKTSTYKDTKGEAKFQGEVEACYSVTVKNSRS